MIIKFPRKFQAGGNLSAKTEYVPIDLRWENSSKDIQPSDQFRVAKEDLTADDKFDNYKLEGLNSDKQSLYNEIETVKARMSGGLSDTYTKEAYENDAKLLHRLVTVEVADQSQKESRFKEVQSAATAAKSDLAINNGQAFVLDLVTGKYDIVSVDKLLTQRASDKSGKKISRYIPQTVGTALEAREGDINFSGRQGGKGQQLEGILHSIQSTKDLQTQLKAAFSGVGSSGNKETNLETIGGVPVNELYNMVLEATGATTSGQGKTTMAITSDATRTNRSQLMNAYNLLKASADASGITETLKRNAYIAYMNEYGDKDKAPEYHSYVNEKVNEQLNNAMLAYLKENHADSLGLKTVGSGSGSGSSSESKEKYDLNPVAIAMDMPAEPIEVFPSNDEAKKELKGRTIFNGAAFPDPSLFDDLGYKQADRDNLPKTVAFNTSMKNFSVNASLQGNLFLPNQHNTQVSELADGQGLTQAILYPGRSPVILHDMPVVQDRRTGKWGIAWDLLLDGKDKNDSTHAKALKMAEDKVGVGAPRAAFDKALAEVYNRLKVDPKVGNLGDIKVRKVIKYDLVIPADPKSWGFYKSGTEKYKSMVTEPNKIKDPSIETIYEALITPGKEGGMELDWDGDLYEMSAFSVMADNATLTDFGNRMYPANKIEMEKARSLAGQRQAQQTNLIGD